MERCPSWELPSHSAAVRRNPKVHYRIHNSPPLNPILSQINPIHTSYVSLKSILMSYCPHTSHAVSPFHVSHQMFASIYLHHASYTSRPSHASQFNEPNNIRWREHSFQIIISWFFHSPLICSFLSQDILFSFSYLSKNIFLHGFLSDYSGFLIAVIAQSV
jgi:hypothetical protein